MRLDAASALNSPHVILAERFIPGKAAPSLNSSGAVRLSLVKFTRPASSLALDSPPFLGCRHNVKLLLPLSLKGSLDAPEKRGESSAARAACDAGREEPKT